MLKSSTTSLINVFTLMMNTPLVDPESMTRPTAIPLKTFSSSRGPSLDYSHQWMVCCFRNLSFLAWLIALSSLQGIAVIPVHVPLAVVPSPPPSPERARSYSQNEVLSEWVKFGTFQIQSNLFERRPYSILSVSILDDWMAGWRVPSLICNVTQSWIVSLVCLVSLDFFYT